MYIFLIFLILFILMPVFMIPIFIEVKDNIPQLIASIFTSMIFSVVGIIFGNLFGCFDKIKGSKKHKIMYCKTDSIIIESETKLKKIEKEMLLEDIVEVNRFEYKGNLNSIAFVFKNKDEEFLEIEECDNIEEVYNFIIKQRELGRKIKITKFDIETDEEIEI